MRMAARLVRTGRLGRSTVSRSVWEPEPIAPRPSRQSTWAATNEIVAGSPVSRIQGTHGTGSQRAATGARKRG